MTETTLRPDQLPPLPEGEVAEVLPPFEPEPLATTLDRLVGFNRRFVYHQNDSTHDLAAVWVASTYGMPVWDWHGRVYITAPQPGCGKSTQAEVMALMCADAVETASLSGPGLFREISARQPVLFIDEAENQWSPSGGRDKEIVTAVVNRGYRPGGYVIRSEGNQAVRHPVYAAVCIVGVDNGLLPDTTRSRCIPVRMVPGGSKPERFRPRQHAEFIDEVRWHLSNAALDYEVRDTGLSMRDGDLWESLYAVADAAGADWPERIRKAHRDHAWSGTVSEAALTLEVVQRYFRETREEKATATTLAAYLSADDGLPTISPKMLKKVMGGYQVEPRRMDGNVSTYLLNDLREAFKQWL